MIKSIQTSFLFILNLLIPIILFGQNNLSNNVSDCFGAVELPIKGDFSIEFTQSPGIYDDIHHYRERLNYAETNSIWIYFTAPYDGKLALNFLNDQFEIEALSFIGPTDYCSEILNGHAKSLSYISPNEKLNNLDSITLKSGEQFYLYLNSNQKEIRKLQLTTAYITSDFERSVEELTTIIDRREDVTAPYTRVSIRDKETKLPVDARLIITDSKSFDALYQGSDILLPTDRSLKFFLKIDALGYFFSDHEIKASADENQNILIELEPISTGKQVELSGIEFFPQSSEFTGEAEIILKRIRDFLLLNSDLKVEIQGHVHRLGRNNFSSKSLSKKRAKKVVKYLVKSGISKERLKAVGYGNLHMKFPEPTSKSEEQANRRVEIKIL